MNLKISSATDFVASIENDSAQSIEVKDFAVSSKIKLGGLNQNAPSFEDNLKNGIANAIDVTKEQVTITSVSTNTKRRKVLTTNENLNVTYTVSGIDNATKADAVAVEANKKINLLTEIGNSFISQQGISVEVLEPSDIIANTVITLIKETDSASTVDVAETINQVVGELGEGVTVESISKPVIKILSKQARVWVFITVACVAVLLVTAVCVCVAMQARIKRNSRNRYRKRA